MVWWDYQHALFYLFGGQGFPISGISGEMNDLWQFEFSSETDSSVDGNFSWIGGSNLTSEPGVYGIQGIPSSETWPGAVTVGLLAIYGDLVYLFGGNAFPVIGESRTDMNTLWSYNMTSLQWTWLSGSSLNSGNGPIYGEKGLANGTVNRPGGREFGELLVSPQASRCVVDGKVELYVFGGLVELNDLWYWKLCDDLGNALAEPTWIWIGGSSNTQTPPTFGTQGEASTSTEPGALWSLSAWTDELDLLYFFAGEADWPPFDGALNTVWAFNVSLPSFPPVVLQSSSVDESSSVEESSSVDASSSSLLPSSSSEPVIIPPSDPPESIVNPFTPDAQTAITVLASTTLVGVVLYRVVNAPSISPAAISTAVSSSLVSAATQSAPEIAEIIGILQTAALSGWYSLDYPSFYREFASFFSFSTLIINFQFGAGESTSEEDDSSIGKVSSMLGIHPDYLFVSNVFSVVLLVVITVSLLSTLYGLKLADEKRRNKSRLQEKKEKYIWIIGGSVVQLAIMAYSGLAVTTWLQLNLAVGKEKDADRKVLITGATTLAFLVILTYVFGFPLLMTQRVLRKLTTSVTTASSEEEQEKENEEKRNHLYGPLYKKFHPKFKLFWLFEFVVKMITGIMIGLLTAEKHAAIQLSITAVVLFLLLVALLVWKPLKNPVKQKLKVLVAGVQLFVVLLLLAFLPSAAGETTSEGGKKAVGVILILAQILLVTLFAVLIALSIKSKLQAKTAKKEKEEMHFEMQSKI